MLVHELQDAYKRAAKLHNMELGRTATQGAAVHWRVPEDLTPDEAHYLCALYARDEFDIVCAGGDRHLRFARWCVQHRPWWRDACAVARYAVFDQLTALAATVAIPAVRI